MAKWLTLALLAISSSTSMVRAETELERQIAACGQLAACDVSVPFGTHVVTKAWNLRDKASLTIRAPVGTQIIWFFDVAPAPSVCMDTTGTRNIAFEGVTFALGNASKRPDVLWLHGRGADARSQAILRVNNAAFLGWYAKAAVVFVAVENEELHSVGFANGVPNTPSLFLSRENELGVVSQFGPVRANPVTMTATNHVYVNCSFGHEGHVGLVPPANNDLGFGITLGSGVHDLCIQGGSTSGGARGGVLRVLGTGNRRVAVISPNWEAKGAKATIVVDGYVYGLSVLGGLLQAVGPALVVNGTAENMVLHPTEMLTAGIVQMGAAGKLAGGGLSVDGFTGR